MIINSITVERSLIVDCTMLGRYSLAQYVIDQGVHLDIFSIAETKNQQRVVVVGGGMSAEREVSYMSANGVVRSLIELGYFVIFVDMGTDIAHVLQTLRPDVVFNALHGTYGEDGCLAGVLNILRIPYTGPGVLVSALAFNKKMSHELFKANNVKVAQNKIVHQKARLMIDPMPRPYVIKPVSQGSSVGVEVIFADDVFSFADYQFNYGDTVIVEEYIQGKEIQVAVLNGKAMGALEIKISPAKRFYDYEVKYTAGLAQHIMPALLSEVAYQQALQISEKVCDIFGAHLGIIRVEMIYQEHEQQFYLLELNTHPGMTPLSICPEILAYCRISYTELVKKIIESAKFE